MKGSYPPPGGVWPGATPDEACRADPSAIAFPPSVSSVIASAETEALAKDGATAEALAEAGPGRPVLRSPALRDEGVSLDGSRLVKASQAQSRLVKVFLKKIFFF